MHSIPVFFVSDRYTINHYNMRRRPDREKNTGAENSPEGDICPAAVCIRVLPKKFQKNYEKQRKRS